MLNVLASDTWSAASDLAKGWNLQMNYCSDGKVGLVDWKGGRLVLNHSQLCQVVAVLKDAKSYYKAPETHELSVRFGSEEEFSIFIVWAGEGRYALFFAEDDEFSNPRLEEVDVESLITMLEQVSRRAIEIQNSGVESPT